MLYLLCGVGCIGLYTFLNVYRKKEDPRRVITGGNLLVALEVGVVCFVAALHAVPHILCREWTRSSQLNQRSCKKMNYIFFGLRNQTFTLTERLQWFTPIAEEKEIISNNKYENMNSGFPNQFLVNTCGPLHIVFCVIKVIRVCFYTFLWSEHVYVS